MDLLRGAKRGKDVDEAEQLRAEGRILHGPRYELIGPEAGRKETFAMLAGAGQQPPADFQGPLLKVIIAAQRRFGDEGRCFLVSEPCHTKFPGGSDITNHYPRELYSLDPLMTEIRCQDGNPDQKSPTASICRSSHHLLSIAQSCHNRKERNHKGYHIISRPWLAGKQSIGSVTHILRCPRSRYVDAAVANGTN